ncbi:hypothetical protein FPRO04_04000 [Fusarium proliferatum]|nr:hypothetical protein FPRO03_06193 [Fusarium proliferatum]KAG4268911.1 hypothetical protein FPRO04_04000 [Fusarium proliferatum]
MRLGMGFNSYTQQLCCNDVVRKADASPVTEEDIKTMAPSAPESSSRGASSILATPKGSMVTRKHSIVAGKDGQNEVSQVVSWSASFVDKASDVTKKLNISDKWKGALSVAVEALGEVKVSGHYIDTNTLKESDATYNITVSVDNERLEVPEMTEFYPIKHVQPSQFTEVYGDCFISGFISGGSFVADIHLKRNEDKKESDMGGQLSIQGQVSGLDVKGDIKGGMTNNTYKKDYNTTITVNWKGGGDIKPNDITEWDIESLLKVAMEFPDKVAACPQNTFAILTKYTSLRSYYRANVLGSPLDYENAGIYTNSLLDAYVQDYKYIWSQIQERINLLDKNLITIHKLEEPEGLQSYRKNFQETYEALKQTYDKSLALHKTDPTQYPRTLEEPLLPNRLEAYAGDLFGLDLAKRDCRLEMIKIVKEVAEVTRDPQVAADPFRVCRYVAPSIFRRLVPADRPIDPPMSKKESEQLKKNVAGDVHRTAQDLQSPRLHQTGDPAIELEKRVNMKYGHKADNWRIGTITGREASSTSGTVFNDLDILDKTYVLSHIAVWYNDHHVVGVELKYMNGQAILHGTKDQQFQTSSYSLQPQEKVCFVGIESHTDTLGSIWIDTIRIGTNRDIWVVEAPKRFAQHRTYATKAPRPMGDNEWDLKGFYGSFDASLGANGITQLGPIWGREAMDEPAPDYWPLFDSDAWLGVYDWHIGLVDSMKFHHHRGTQFRLSPMHGHLNNSSGIPFNALDIIDKYWILKKFTFFFTTSSEMLVLSGVSADYTNKKQLQYGKCDPSATAIVPWDPQMGSQTRVVGVAICIKERQSLPQQCLGLKLRIEKDPEKPKESPKGESKDMSKSEVKDTPKDGSVPDRSKTSKEEPEPVAPEISDQWIMGDLAITHEETCWGAVSSCPSSPKGNWTIRGFAGHACPDGIEALMVIWGRA